MFLANRIECIDHSLLSHSTCILLRIRRPPFPLAKDVARSFLHDCLLRGASAIRTRGCVRIERWFPPTGRARTLAIPDRFKPLLRETVLTDSNKLAIPPFLATLFIYTKHENAALPPSKVVQGRHKGIWRPQFCEVSPGKSSYFQWINQTIPPWRRQ